MLGQWFLRPPRPRAPPMAEAGLARTLRSKSAKRVRAKSRNKESVSSRESVKNDLDAATEADRQKKFAA